MSQFISLQDAISLTGNFRSNKENILDSTYRNQGTLPICETFARQVFDDLLQQSDCTSIRIYLGLDSNHKVKLVVVGADSNDDDILATNTELIAEEGHRYPPNTPPSSALNS
jgi:hypothetical protein